MGTYKEIQGYKIDAVSSDPSTTQKGQIWYNTTSEVLKYAGPGAWAAITASPLAKELQFTAGTTTACVIAGGSAAGPGVPTNNATSEWNGTGWSAGGNLAANIKVGACCGTATAAYRFGGGYGGPLVLLTELYNGTSWSAQANLPGTCESNGGSGSSTSAMSTGGSGTLANTNSIQFTGTCWNDGPSLTGSISSTGAQGDSATSAMVAGGQPGQAPPGQKGCQQFNGTSWSNIAAELLEARTRTSGIGGTNAGIIASGDAPGGRLSTAETWNGTSWSSLSNIAGSAVSNCGGSTEATSTSHMLVGGSTSPSSFPGAAEIYSEPSIKTVTAT